MVCGDFSILYTWNKKNTIDENINLTNLTGDAKLTAVTTKAQALISAIIDNNGVIDDDATDNTDYLKKAYDLYVKYADLVKKADAADALKDTSQLAALKVAYENIGSADDYVQKVKGTTDSDKVKALKDALKGKEVMVCAAAFQPVKFVMDSKAWCHFRITYAVFCCLSLGILYLFLVSVFYVLSLFVFS